MKLKVLNRAIKETEIMDYSASARIVVELSTSSSIVSGLGAEPVV